MPQHRIIANPVRLTGSVHPQQLSALVAIDAMVRRRVTLGEPPPVWELATMVGDAAVQRAVERAVAREGDDREELGRDGFAARSRQLVAEAEADLAQLLRTLGVQVDLNRWSSSSEDVVSAARVAFVRLYEGGVLSRSDAVVDSCPSCETVVDATDADAVELPTQHVRLQIPLAEGVLQLDVAEPELLVGAVAVAVPAESAPADTSVYLPLLDAEVPIVGVLGLTKAVVVVPGHDAWSHQLALEFRYPVVQVLDADGIVRRPGPLVGLGRYAARAAATEQLGAEGFVAGHFEAEHAVKRCHRCGTVLVPLLGRHWMLALSELVPPVIEMVEAGQIGFSPANELEQFLDASHHVGSWCVSQQLWSGVRIPVATCLDCGAVRVSVEEETSCGICMGTLEPDSDVLDARFISAVIPLVMKGWPQALEQPGTVETTLSVGRIGLEAWALPMAVLGYRLAELIPFERIVVHHSAVGAEEPGARPTSELIELVETEGPRIVRAALLTGDFDIVRARDSVSAVDTPVMGVSQLGPWIESYDKALIDLDAGGAFGILVRIANEGLDSESAGSLVELLPPLLSE